MQDVYAELARLLRELFSAEEMRRLAKIYEPMRGEYSHALPEPNPTREAMALTLVTLLRRRHTEFPADFLDLLLALRPEVEARLRGLAEGAGCALGGEAWPEARRRFVEDEMEATPVLSPWLRPFAHLWLRVAPGTMGTEQKKIHAYLLKFISEMDRQNESVLAPGHFVDPQARPKESELRDSLRDGHVPHRVRQVEGVQDGGTRAGAAMAMAEHPSRFVTDVVTEVLRDPRPCVLLAEPGMGKSMTLRQVGATLARKNLYAWRAQLPVYIRLAEFRDPGPTPEVVLRFVRRQFAAEEKGLIGQFDRLLDEGRLVLLFDGMDEMDRRDYPQRVKALSDFALQWQSACRTLFACRTNDFVKVFRHKQFVLVPFDEPRMMEFVRLNLFSRQKQLTVSGQSYTKRRAAAFVRALRGTPLGDELRTPLFLALSCRYVVDTGELPEARGDLFCWFVDELVTRFMLDKGKANEEKPEPDAVRAGWAELAYVLTRAAEGTVLSEAELTSRLSDASTLDWGKAAGVLTPHETPTEDGELETSYSFVHHRLQEYLAAVWLVENPEPEDLDWRAALDVPRWQEIVLHLAGMDDGTHPVFRELSYAMIWSDKPGPFRESLLADRALLGARVHAVNPRAISSTRLEISVERMVAGRPTSQAKALQLAGDFPWALELCVNTLKDSPISWVRRHALVLMGQRARELKQDPRLMMGLSLVRDSWPEELWDFLDLVRQDGMARWAPAFVIACGSWVAGQLALVGLPLAGLALGASLMETREPAGLLAVVGGGWGLVMGGVSLAVYQVLRRRLEGGAAVAGVATTTTLVATIWLSDAFAAEGVFIGLIGAIVLLELPLVIGLASTLVSGFIRAGAFVFWTAFHGWSREDGAALYREAGRSVSRVGLPEDGLGAVVRTLLEDPNDTLGAVMLYLFVGGFLRSALAFGLNLTKPNSPVVTLGGQWLGLLAALSMSIMVSTCILVVGFTVWEEWLKPRLAPPPGTSSSRRTAARAPRSPPVPEVAHRTPPATGAAPSSMASELLALLDGAWGMGRGCLTWSLLIACALFAVGFLFFGLAELIAQLGRRLPGGVDSALGSGLSWALIACVLFVALAMLARSMRSTWRTRRRQQPPSAGAGGRTTGGSPQETAVPKVEHAGHLTDLLLVCPREPTPQEASRWLARLQDAEPLVPDLGPDMVERYWTVVRDLEEITRQSRRL